jgi:RimJ/RimL family protein N-acetyltransferase
MTIPEPIPGPAYRIETRRLVLRCWNPADAPLLKAAIDASVEHVRPWLPFASREPLPLQSKIDLIRHWRSEFDASRDFVYGIFSRDESRVLGGTGLHTRLGTRVREIGYWIHQDFTRQGYATETAAALTKVAFEVDHVERVEIHCDPNNVHSAAVARKLGYTLDATLRRRALTSAGDPRDTMIWSLFADEYPATPCAALELAAFDAAGRRLLQGLSFRAA